MMKKEAELNTVLAETINDEEFKRTGVPTARGDEEHRASFLHLQEIGAFDENILKERHAEIENLNKDMIEVNMIFKDVAALVGE
jgi:hypothetical protein